MSRVLPLLALAVLAVAAEALLTNKHNEIEKKIKMDQRPIFFTSSRHKRSPEELNSPGVAKAVHLNSPGVAKAVHLNSPGVAKAVHLNSPGVVKQNVPLTKKKVVKRAARTHVNTVAKRDTSDTYGTFQSAPCYRSQVVNDTIAHMHNKGNSSYGTYVDFPRATFSLLLNNNNINHMRVGLPDLMPNFKNPTWVETHPAVHAELDKDSFYHVCFPKNKKKRTIEISPAAKNFLRSVLNQKNNKVARHEEGDHGDDQGDLDTDHHRYDPNRRVACAPYFMIVGASGIGAQDLANMLAWHHRHVQPIYFENYNYWDTRECTANIQCSGDFIPPTFADYKSIHQDACEQVRRNSYFLEDDTEYHAMVIGDVFNGLLNWNPCWKNLTGNSDRVAPLVTTSQLVQAMLPALKVVVMMRDPVKKTLGLYRQTYRVAKSNDDFDPAEFHDKMTEEKATWKHCRDVLGLTNHECLYYFMDNGQVSILTQSLYHLFVSDYLNVFGEENTFFLRFEDFKDDHVAKLAEIGEFLKVPDIARGEEHLIVAEVNTRNPGNVTMLDETRLMLKDFFYPHDKALRDMIGAAFTWV